MGWSFSEGDGAHDCDVPKDACAGLVKAVASGGDVVPPGFAAMTAGFANYVWRTSWEGRELVVKCFTDLVYLRIDRHAVGAIDVLAGQCGVGPKVHSCGQNGLVMDYLPGRTLQEADIHAGNQRLLACIAEQLQLLHRQPIPKAAFGEPMLWRTMDKMLLVAEGCPELLPSSIPSLPEIREEVGRAREAVEALSPGLVCGHGDFKPSNVIEYLGDVRLIDFELGGPNYRGFDWMKLFRRPEGFLEEDLRHFLAAYSASAEEPCSPQQLDSLVEETKAFEPLTWLEAFIFFLSLPPYKPTELQKWHQLAQHRWQMYQQTRHKLIRS
mmetsp:Transcript_50997/g.95454  ORF Transcript_50997/g.95454 Transcript_50997/m.95454 type:complete len:325 (-) Transcript_50997:147-1121(-)